MYQWLVFAHILGVFGFLLAHGAAAAVSFKLRGERQIERIHALLDLSRSVTTVASISLLVLLAAGVTLGFMGHWWGQYWIWTSLGLFILMGVSMMALGTRPFSRIRQVVSTGAPSGAKSGIQPQAALAIDKQLPALLADIHPMLLSIAGGGGLAIILWLMMFKPF